MMPHVFRIILAKDHQFLKWLAILVGKMVVLEQRQRHRRQLRQEQRHRQRDHLHHQPARLFLTQAHIQYQGMLKGRLRYFVSLYHRMFLQIKNFRCMVSHAYYIILLFLYCLGFRFPVIRSARGNDCWLPAIGWWWLHFRCFDCLACHLFLYYIMAF